eukprot:CAMPEP_0182515380 /NCGR_PEP_ID=MMETSP1321-20130603/37957_1 /TAXON_ID=91990 /ORGANISM="Bolidomonas sp., Strain RCC1657" /LENGTH=56 /DNA_ID=CAMNT_0024722787 /DNA_START=79 /DNA_END=246 /DNA_ORIENTATION=-
MASAQALSLTILAKILATAVSHFCRVSLKLKWSFSTSSTLPPASASASTSLLKSSS